MKQFKLIISWSIWTLLSLYMLILLLIQLPSVQSWMGGCVASYLSDKLDTDVVIKRVELGFLNRIILDDVTIDDQQGQKMLNIGRLSVKIDLLPLLKGSISISSAQLFGAHAELYKPHSDAPTNYQFVIDALQSSDNKESKGIDLHIGSLIIRNSGFSYNQLDTKETPGIINGKHLNVSDISAYILLKTLHQDTLNVNIKRLALNEHSGVRVDRLSLLLEANQKKASISRFALKLPASSLVIDDLTANYRLDLPNDTTLSYHGSIAPSVIFLPDLAFLVPKLKDFDSPLTMSASVEGSKNSVDITQTKLHSEDGQLALEGNFRATKLTKPFVWAAAINRLDISNNVFAQLKQTFPELPDIITRLGHLHLTGLAEGRPSGDMALLANISMGIGRVEAQLDMDVNDQFSGHLITDSLHLGQLFDYEELGQMAGRLDVHGSKLSTTASGHLQHIVFKDYPYQDIDLDLTYQTQGVAGKMKINDPNIITDIEGELKRGKRTSIRLTGTVRDLAPQELHLSDKWGTARFSAIIDTDFSASSLDDAEGTIDIDDFLMTSSDAASVNYHLDNIHIKSGYSESCHFMRLNGDMGEVYIQGKFDWETLPQSFVSYVASLLPTLPGLPKVIKPSNNNFEATIALSDSEWLEKIMGIPLQLQPPLQLKATVDDSTNCINIDGRLNNFTYNGAKYADGLVRLTNHNDTAYCNIELAKLSNEGSQTDLRLEAKAADNQILTSIYWEKRKATGLADKAMSGVFNAITQLYTNEQGKPEAQVRIQPSMANIRGTQWFVEPCDIIYTDNHLLIDLFNMRHDDQHVIVDGVASADKGDSLLIDLNGIELDYVLDLVDFHSVNFGGKATVKAYVTGLFGDFDAWADLEVQQFTFMNGPMGDLTARAEWSKEDKQVDLEAFADEGADAQTFIDGFVAPSRNDIDLLVRARGTNVSFVNTFTDAFFDNVGGKAYGDVRVIGPLSSVNITGELAVDGHLTVSALGTTYQLKGDSVFFVPNDIRLKRHRIYDADGHEGYLTGGLHHRNLTNFTFDLDVESEGLMVYNFPTFEEGGTICGLIYANGQADLHGRPGEITINCSATPQRGSMLGYNAVSPDAISKQQFISWKEAPTLPVASPPDTSEKTSEREHVASGQTTDIHINFLINATSESILKVLMDQNTGDMIALNGSGTIRAAYYNKGPFQMFGTYEVERGTYGITIQNILKKNFQFRDGGTIIFGGDPYDAQLNLQAQYTVGGVSLSDLQLGNSFSNNTIRVNCLMNISGTPGSPRVDFDLEMPTVNSEEQQMIRSIIATEQELNQQVVYLLGIGRFYTQQDNNAGTQQYGQTELAMQSLLSGTVSSQINEVLSQVVKNDDWNFGANISTGNEGWHNAEYEGTVSGRMLTGRLLINGQFGYRDNATQSTPTFIGDFDLRYLLTPGGGLSVKVYNQTNDRYFTRSALNTQGIGLIMKKDFSSFSDLFVKRRKSKDKSVSK